MIYIKNQNKILNNKTLPKKFKKCVIYTMKKEERVINL